MQEIVEEFFNETTALVMELRDRLCEAASRLQQMDAEFGQEKIQHALALAVLQALTEPCGEIPVYDPRLIPKWMEGIGLPHVPRLGR